MNFKYLPNIIWDTLKVMWLFGSSKQLHPLWQSLSLWEAPAFLITTRVSIVMIDESNHENDADDEMVLIISGLVIY